jgi:hypothetical protein
LPKLRAIGHHVSTRLLEGEQLADTASWPIRYSSGSNIRPPPKLVSAPLPSALVIHRCMRCSARCAGFSHVPAGFRHRELRPLVAGLISRDLTTYSTCAMTYDLRRLRLHGLIERVDGTHHYTITTSGLRVAFFDTTLQRRLLQLGDSTTPEIPSPLRAAVRQLEAALQKLWNHADRHAQAA